MTRVPVKCLFTSNINLKLYRCLHRSNVWNTQNEVLKENVPNSQKVRKTFFKPDGPDLNHFIKQTISVSDKKVIENHIDPAPYLDSTLWQGFNRKVYFDVYGCQMNVNDTEIIWSILKCAGFQKTNCESDADIILIVTCAIRDNAENKIWERLAYLRSKKRKKLRSLKIGILGCMAERLKHSLIEKERAVDLVAGPDSYRDLPRLLALTENNQSAVNVLLSLDETYADVMPVRLNEDSVSAFVSIMRGCDNMCTYCIVPFTRGRERSRPVESIVNEIKKLSYEGVKEVTLLGQNVNSYRDTSQETFYSYDDETRLAKGFKTVYKNKKGGLRFADLLERVSQVDPEMRIRFTSPHPKDFPDEVLHLINERNNICKNIHLPAQSGNSRILEKMRRGYTREAYLELVQRVYSLIPNVTLSSDFICGFCSETDEEFQDTLSLIKQVDYTATFLFAYSMREKTTAHRRYHDDVSSEVKKHRLIEMNKVFRETVSTKNKTFVGQVQLVLVEGKSKRSEHFLAGRNEGNQKVIFPAIEIPTNIESNETIALKPGDYVAIRVTDSTSQVLKGEPLYHSTITDFNADVIETRLIDKV